MTCECGCKGVNCDQGRRCPLRQRETLPPGLSRELWRTLAIYLALVFGAVLLLRACA